MFDKYPALKWVLLLLVILIVVPLFAILVMMAMGVGMMGGMMGHMGGGPMMILGVVWLALIIAALVFLIVVLARGTKHV